ncbi:MAG: diguanylate cyclase [Deltaproteobacteria bacterium]|nr:diguanylate cyclase [Deltaproteobacteria bacterium]
MDPNNIDYKAESMLIVDDDDFLRETLEELVATLGFSVESASNGAAALEILENRTFTFLLTDMKMPGMDGLELIQAANEQFPGISMIAMTGYSEGYKYVDVINAGASDFIKKPFELGELEAKLRRIIVERNLRVELNRLSITDSLTGLFNQRHFYTRLKEEVLRANRQNRSLALILLDLDNFKAYNDAHGHLAGDDILKNVGQLITQSIRVGVDSGYRYGGDEFAVILIEADLSVARGISERIQSALKENGSITASVGCTIFTQGMTVTDLVAETDKALYRDKNGKMSNRL